MSSFQKILLQQQTWQADVLLHEWSWCYYRLYGLVTRRRVSQAPRICWEQFMKCLEDTWISCHVVLTRFDAGLPHLSRFGEERKYYNYKHLYIYLSLYNFFFTFTDIHKILHFNGKNIKPPYKKTLLDKQIILGLAANIWFFIENYFLTSQFYAILGKLKLCETNFYWKSKLFWVKWKLSFKTMFCKNGKLALKICFKASETFEFIFFIFVAKPLDAIWRRPGVGREMQEEKEKR